MITFLVYRLSLQAYRGADAWPPWEFGGRRQIGVRRNWTARIPPKNLDITKKRGKRFAHCVLELLTTKLCLDALRGAGAWPPWGFGGRRQIGVRRNWTARIPSENLDITKKRGKRFAYRVLELLTRFELVTRFAPKILRIFGDPGEIGHGGSVPLRLHAAPKPLEGLGRCITKNHSKQITYCGFWSC